MKRDRCLAPLIGCFVLLASLGAIAPQAGYDLWIQLSDGKQKQTATNRESDAPKPTQKRPLMEAHADTQFTATWKVARSAKDEAKEILVHFYVVRIGRPGEAPPPLEPKRVVIESALTMDFPPGETAGASLKFKVEEPGTYLVRIEARPNADEPGREEFAAMDLVIK